jgi:hypothetical protein
MKRNKKYGLKVAAALACGVVAASVAGCGGAPSQLEVKGLSLGMPVQDAAEVMLDHGLPPGGEADWPGFPDGRPYSDGGPWTGKEPLELREETGGVVFRFQGRRLLKRTDVGDWLFAVDDEDRVIGVVLGRETVDEIFGAGSLEAEAFAQEFIDAYSIPEMDFDGSKWVYTDTENGWTVSITVQKVLSLETADKTSFG